MRTWVLRLVKISTTAIEYNCEKYSLCPCEMQSALPRPNENTGHFANCAAIHLIRFSLSVVTSNMESIAAHSFEESRVE